MTSAYASKRSGAQPKPVLTMDNVDQQFCCLSVEEIAQRVAKGGRPSAHPQGVFRFKDATTMNKVDAMVGARLAEYLKVYGESDNQAITV